jgi:hypothetical protein
VERSSIPDRSATIKKCRFSIGLRPYRAVFVFPATTVARKN